ncbi:hypothetical protein LCGC14_1733130 [marine sediment metagenome]|uniref:Uncharacterized protein n=1 Tax=marine sediment metagenome TaxID=412755 RepID=A0A0F9K8I9_9ZZZZ
MTIIKRILTMRCVSGHEHHVEDDDGVIGRQGYVRCNYEDCERNAFTVKVTSNVDDINDDMHHLNVSGACLYCGRNLEESK